MQLHNIMPSVSRSFPLRVFALLVVTGLFLIPKPAEAAILSAFTIIATAISTAITGFFALIMNIQGVLINWLIEPANWGAAFTQNVIVINAWQIMRDFANLGFALAIIVIAIGFILRIQTYGSQRTLTRLIIAAIMVNFSLVIAGVFIDAASVISKFFLDGFGMRDVWGSLLNASGALALFQPSDETPLMARALGFIARLWPPIDIAAASQIIIRTLIVSVFSIMMIAALAALIIMLVLRMAYIWILLVLAPIAWVSWIFPAFENNWKRWWQEFIRWTFFAPIVIFFLAFSLAIMGDSTGTTVPADHGGQGILATVQVVARAIFALPDEPVDMTLARLTIAITMVVLSMIIANQMGISFANQGVQWATSVGRWPGRTLWREGKGRFATSSLGKALEERFARSRIPGVGAFADSLRGIRTKVEDDSKKNADRYKILSSEQIRQDLADPQKRAMLSQADLLARARVLNDRGEQLPDSIANTVLQTAHNTNPKFAEQFLPMNPQLVQSYEATIARRTGDKRRTFADYASRMTEEQAENFNIKNAFKSISSEEGRKQAQALFASGIKQNVLAHMLTKNHESGALLLETLHNSAQLQKLLQDGSKDSNLTNDRIAQILTKTRGMLKSPQIAYWVTGEAAKASEPKIT